MSPLQRVLWLRLLARVVGAVLILAAWALILLAIHRTPLARTVAADDVILPGLCILAAAAALALDWRLAVRARAEARNTDERR